MALKKANQWIEDHQEEEGDFAGIQPPMINSMLVYHYNGMSKDDPRWVKGWEAIERFLIHREENTNMQACVSPLWDTSDLRQRALRFGNTSGPPGAGESG